MKRSWTFLYGSILMASVLAECNNDKPVQSFDPLLHKGDQVPDRNFTCIAVNKAPFTNDAIYNVVIGHVF